LELLAEVQFALARTLWDAPQGEGRDRERARTLARQARVVIACAIVSSLDDHAKSPFLLSMG
jgi:hypothetical protein